MLAQLNTVVFSGIEAKLVDIQVHISRGLPAFNIVGLANKTVTESKERIRAAFSELKFDLPPKRIVVNLSPSDLTKEGNHFDLPIALALLIAIGQLPKAELNNYLALGELSLSGDILPVNGTLAALITCVKHKKSLIFPQQQVKEVGLFHERLKLIPAPNLKSLIDHFKGNAKLAVNNIEVKPQQPENDYFDLAHIKGQEHAKQALKIAAAGGHNLLFIGPPGVGKSTLAYAIKGILPKLSKVEMLETSVIYSIAGHLGNNNLVTNRPFRAPHHSISDAALIGGGKKILPGEITLAHNGILFLDELAEFKRSSLDALRQPLESSKILISRANEKVEMPCNFQLIAATNPCTCGYFGTSGKECHKAPLCAVTYQNKISGPLLDRIDLIVELSLPENILQSYEINALKSSVETSAQVKEQVFKARHIQNQRYKGYSFSTNANVNTTELNNIIKNIQRSPKAWKLLSDFAEKLNISMRSYNKILKITRTISDLEGVEQINELHISEAVMFRQLAK